MILSKRSLIKIGLFKGCQTNAVNNFLQWTGLRRRFLKVKKIKTISFCDGFRYLRPAAENDVHGGFAAVNRGADYVQLLVPSLRARTRSWTWHREHHNQATLACDAHGAGQHRDYISIRMNQITYKIGIIALVLSCISLMFAIILPSIIDNTIQELEKISYDNGLPVSFEIARSHFIQQNRRRSNKETNSKNRLYW